MDKRPKPAIEGGREPWVIGSLNVDLFHYPNGEVRTSVGGMAYNAWVTMTDLGMRPRLLASVGSDEEGDFLLGSLERTGIPTGHIARNGASRTGRAVYRVTPAGARLQDLRLHAPLGRERLEAVLDSASPVLFMGGASTDLALIETCRPLFWNPGLGILTQGQHAATWAAADVLFVNEREWREYQAQGGPQAAVTVVTRHRRGADVLVEGERVARSAPKQYVGGVDVGAGDSFAAAFASCCLDGTALEDCLRAATEQAVRFLTDRAADSNEER
jgi:sugar/nucleoside kinase (ribokinase family)